MARFNVLVIVLAALASATAFVAPAAPVGRAQRGVVTMARPSLPKIELPSVSLNSAYDVAKPIRATKTDKGNFRKVGGAGYNIGDVSSLQASFCFVPIKDDGPRVEFWEKIAERRAIIRETKPERSGPKFSAPKFSKPDIPKFEAPAVPKFSNPFAK